MIINANFFLSAVAVYNFRCIHPKGWYLYMLLVGFRPKWLLPPSRKDRVLWLDSQISLIFRING